LIRPDRSLLRTPRGRNVATAVLRIDGVASRTIQVSRAAWGRKGRIQLQIFGAPGAIFFDQERFNEVGIYLAEGPAEDQGIRTVLMAPAHPPYERFIPAGHQMGFNEAKVIEAHELLNRIAGKPSLTIDFDQGLAIERVIHAIARAHREARWQRV
jgi:predicted dehydrogenase